MLLDFALIFNILAINYAANICPSLTAVSFLLPPTERHLASQLLPFC